MATSMLHVRLDEDLKGKANAVLADLGLTASDAVRLLFHRIVADQAFPLELKLHQAEPAAAATEAAAAEEEKPEAETPAAPKFWLAEVDEGFADLDHGRAD